MEQYIVTGRVADGNFTPFRATVQANSEAEAIYNADRDHNDTIYYLKGLKAVTIESEIEELKAKYQRSLYVNIISIALVVTSIITYTLGVF